MNIKYRRHPYELCVCMLCVILTVLLVFFVAISFGLLLWFFSLCYTYFFCFFSSSSSFFRSILYFSFYTLFRFLFAVAFSLLLLIYVREKFFLSQMVFLCVYMGMHVCECTYIFSSAPSWFTLCNILYKEHSITLHNIQQAHIRCMCMCNMVEFITNTHIYILNLVRLFVWSVLTLSYPLFSYISFGFLMHSQVTYFFHSFAFAFCMEICLIFFSLSLSFYNYFMKLLKCIDIFSLYERSKVLFYNKWKNWVWDFRSTPNTR